MTLQSLCGNQRRWYGVLVVTRWVTGVTWRQLRLKATFLRIFALSSKLNSLGNFQKRFSHISKVVKTLQERTTKTKIICNLQISRKSFEEMSFSLSTRGGSLMLDCKVRIATKSVLLWERVSYCIRFCGTLLTLPRWTCTMPYISHCDWPKKGVLLNVRWWKKICNTTAITNM